MSVSAPTELLAAFTASERVREPKPLLALLFLLPPETKSPLEIDPKARSSLDDENEGGDVGVFFGGRSLMIGLNCNGCSGGGGGWSDDDAPLHSVDTPDIIMAVLVLEVPAAEVTDPRVSCSGGGGGMNDAVV